MKSPHETDRLSSSLRRLQSRRASADFTERVLDALDARLARRRRRRAVAVAVALPAAALLVAGLLWLDRTAGARRTARAEQLLQQRAALEAELARLERARDRSRPVLYLGTGESYDLVLDLQPLLDRSLDTPVVPALQDLRAQPARVVETSRRRP